MKNKKESTITVKCVQCKEKRIYKASELPTEQPFCDKCYMPMLLDEVVAHA